jgi:hypothetical protein
LQIQSNNKDNPQEGALNTILNILLTKSTSSYTFDPTLIGSIDKNGNVVLKGEKNNQNDGDKTKNNQLISI